jgi:hypothetical protein
MLIVYCEARPLRPKYVTPSLHVVLRRGVVWILGQRSYQVDLVSDAPLGRNDLAAFCRPEADQLYAAVPKAFGSQLFVTSLLHCFAGLGSAARRLVLHSRSHSDRLPREGRSRHGRTNPSQHRSKPSKVLPRSSGATVRGPVPGSQQGFGRQVGARSATRTGGDPEIEKATVKEHPERSQAGGRRRRRRCHQSSSLRSRKTWLFPRHRGSRPRRARYSATRNDPMPTQSSDRP